MTFIGKHAAMVFECVLIVLCLRCLGYSIAQWQWWAGLLILATVGAILDMWHDKCIKN